MCKAIRSFMAIAALGFSASAAIADAGRVSFETKPAAGSGGLAIEVSGRDGRYQSAHVLSGAIPLSVAAVVSDDDNDIKIVQSEIYFKGEGPKKNMADELAFRSVPVRSTAFDTPWVEIPMDGLLMQDAIAACNALSDRPLNAESRKISLPVGVVWRVATARFQFNWRNYERVGPTDTILKNADFYTDRQEAVHEAAVDAEIVCKGLSDGSSVIAHSSTSKPSAVRRVSVEPPETGSVDHVDNKSKMAVVVNSGKPRCDGGMVRALSDGDESYLCLCPGNTRRIATGNNAFSCVRPRR